MHNQWAAERRLSDLTRVPLPIRTVWQKQWTLLGSAAAAVGHNFAPGATLYYWISLFEWRKFSLCLRSFRVAKQLFFTYSFLSLEKAVLRLRLVHVNNNLFIVFHVLRFAFFIRRSAVCAFRTCVCLRRCQRCRRSRSRCRSTTCGVCFVLCRTQMLFVFCSHAAVRF